jgi:putative hydrolase of the HAD superfamily
MRVLLWDFDGTLGYRAGGAWTASLLETVRRLAPGRPVTSAQLQPYTQEGFPWQMPELAHHDLDTPDAWWAALHPVFVRAYRGVGFERSEADDLARWVRETYLDPDRWRQTEGAETVLASLRDAGWQHVMLSNHVPELDTLLDHLGLVRYFERVFNSAKIGYEKPNPAAFEAVKAAFPNGAVRWMIGDSFRADIEGAAAAGIPGILVHRAHPEARIVCESLRDVRDYLIDGGKVDEK